LIVIVELQPLSVYTVEVFHHQEHEVIRQDVNHKEQIIRRRRRRRERQDVEKQREGNTANVVGEEHMVSSQSMK